MASRDFDLDLELRRVLETQISFGQDESKSVAAKVPNLLEKVRLLSTLKFLEYTQTIKEKAYTLRLLGVLFLLESLAAAKANQKTEKVFKILQNNISSKDKIALLDGFLFSKKYRFGTDSLFPLRHLMFEAFDNDGDFKKKYYIFDKVEDCGSFNSTLCYCRQWLRESPKKVDSYLKILVKHLYEMRHAVVHEAFPVLGLPDYGEKHLMGSFSSSVLDTYPLTGKNKKYFRAYESTIDPDIFFEILRSGVKNYLTGKYLD